MRALLEEVGDLAAALQVADPAQRAQLYQELGVSGLYEPASRMVIVTVDPWVRRRSVVSEGDMRLEATPLLAHVAALAA